ncbi:MAG: pilus assembly protein [Alphaproteobacteria bacterium]|nr:pilus assembly protein [Alphaproteobacteria bacterium]
MRAMKRFWNATGGASALEFALVLPVFATMLFGTIQMGLAYYFAGSVQYALERTARLTMVDQDMSASQVQTAFSNELATFTDQDIDVNYVVDSAGDVPIAQLTANYQHDFIVPFVPSFSVTFTAETRVPLEPAPAS